VSDKSTRKAPDYAVESRAARNRSVFDRNCSIGLAIPIRSGTIQANRCRKRRFLFKSVTIVRCAATGGRVLAQAKAKGSYELRERRIYQLRAFG
jgi:hypothetical protein